VGTTVNDIVVLNRIHVMNGKKYMALVWLYVVLMVGKISLGLAFVGVTLTPQSVGATRRALYAAVVFFEIGQGLVGLGFWTSLAVATKSSNARSSGVEVNRFVTRILKDTVIVNLVLMIIFWTLASVYLLIYGVIYDYLWMPAYVFALIPASIISLTKEKVKEEAKNNRTSIITKPNSVVSNRNSVAQDAISKEHTININMVPQPNQTKTVVSNL